MNGGTLRNRWLYGIAAATAFAAPLARAQDTPAPSPTAAPIITPPASARPQQLPGVIPERFSIGPTATPTATPAPAPTPTPSASATPAPRRAAPVPRATAPAGREAAPVPTLAPTPSATPASVPLAAPTPLASPATQPAATVAPASPPEAVTPPWLWAAAGAGGTALLGLGGWAMLRRRRREEDEEEVFEAEPAAAAPPPPARVQPPPGLTPPPAPPVPAAPIPVSRGEEPFELALNPHRVIYGEREVMLEFELLVGNASGAPAENIRIAFAAMSASAQQDAVIAGFHGGPPGEPGGAPFDLAPGAGARLPVRLAIPQSGIHAVQVGGRPLFVPIVLIDLRWRGGLSVRRFGADFMLGTVGQGDKLGPLWLDRPAPSGPMAANRYFARQVAAA